MGKVIKPQPVTRSLSVFDQIMGHAKYAQASHSTDLIYEAYGEAKMAWQLGAITKDQFYALNNELIVYYNRHGSQFE